MADRLILIFILGVTMQAQTGGLRKAEKMTDAEMAQHNAAIAKVVAAQADLEKTEAMIAAAHGMGKESYMEWARWYVFDGDFVCERYVNYMSGLSRVYFPKENGTTLVKDEKKP